MMKWLCFSSAALTWPLISFGAFVRLKGAGLSCPDWPLCYGKLIPPPGFEISLEMGHRFIATLLGILIIWMTVTAYRQPKYQHLKKLSLLSLILVCIQGILGALTVTMVLWPPVVTMHLIGGNLLFAILVYMARISTKESQDDAIKLEPVSAEQIRKKRHVWWMFAVLFLIITSGGYNSTTYSGYSCGAFPGCHEGSFASFGASGIETLSGYKNSILPAAPVEYDEYHGRFMPEYFNEWIHMIHRLIALTGGILLIFMSWLWLKKGAGYHLVHLHIILLINLEITVGVFNAIYRIPVPISSLHTAIAATLTGVLAYVLANIKLEPN